jgi:hypothetical protein
MNPIKFDVHLLSLQVETEIFKLKYLLKPLKTILHLFVCQDGNERFDSKWLGPERVQVYYKKEWNKLYRSENKEMLNEKKF